MIGKPQSGENDPYFNRYIDQVGNEDPMQILREKPLLEQLQSLSEEKWSHRYEPSKWSIKEKFLHVIDTERVFAYRALRISRNDKTDLRGFEQDDFAEYSSANDRSAESLMEEFETVRSATLSLVNNLSSEQLKRIGVCSGRETSARAIVYILAGHELHHVKILKEKYLTHV